MKRQKDNFLETIDNKKHGIFKNDKKEKHRT